MKLRKIVALLLCFAMILSMSACSVKTKNDADKKNDVTSNEGGSSEVEIPKLVLLGMSKNEKIVNVVRDQLIKNGFEVELNLQPDWGSYDVQSEADNYDIKIADWTTSIGNGDYAVRELFRSDGASNACHLNDPDLDKLIDQAATLTFDESIPVYKAFEDKLVTEHAYVLPLFNTIKSQAYNKEILKNITIKKGREAAWEQFDFVDESKRDTQVAVITDIFDSITSFDPIKANDGATVMNNANMCVRLMNLDDKNVPTVKGTLSRNYAIAEGNSDVYFLLRDDVNFAKVEGKKAVDSGVLVGAEDVIYSIDRARNKDSVPDHRTYSVYSEIKGIEIVTDITILDSVKISGTDKNLKDELQNGLESPIKELVADKASVKNSDGKYQLVKVSTKEPFPQLINTLAHPSSGIVCKEQIEKINTYDVKTYDRTKDIAYGDQSTITEGDTYNNTLYCSGPYIPIFKNDYEIYFEKNPNYMKGTESEPKIAKISSRIIKDIDSAISALRNGELHYVKRMNETHYDIVKSDPKLELLQIPSNSVTYLACNLKENKITTDENIRKAIMYALNQDEIKAVFNNQVMNAFSTLSPLMDTGNKLVADPAKTKEYLNKYFEGKK